jgi:hypothetical protein
MAALIAEPPAVLPSPGTVECWRPAPLAIDPWTVLRLCRYRSRAAVEPVIAETARRVAADAEALAEPAAVLRAFRVEGRAAGGVRLAGGPVLSGAGVARLLDGCPLAVLFALTLGPGLEAEVAGFTERREPLEAFLLDTAGWAAIEASVRALRQDLGGRARARGWRVTHRLAPGYGDWPLAEQAALVDALGDTGGIVSLSAHGVLVPFKSVTGVFGLAPGPLP